jgi:D-alanyl-lipoteichoic acid acyltransferase DltB (MBOAT superfamily)
MLLLLLFAFVAYVLAARFILARFRSVTRDILFALLNAPPFFVVFFRHPPIAIIYFALVILCYAMFHLFAGDDGWKPWVAFSTPIAALIFARYIFPLIYVHFAQYWYVVAVGMPQFFGISYLAFRNSYLVLQVRNGVVKKPGFWGYMAYSFFLPTMFVGPINPYSNFVSAFNETPPAIPIGRSAMRLLIGLVKFEFVGNVLSRLTYAGLLRDDHYHPWIDLPIAVVFYYLYLYFNFSGFCDIAIGAAGLIGIPVAENFDNPFAARNGRDFWNRWHITLSEYMRDVFFSPVSKFFVRLFGPANANHAIAFTILLVFLIIGVWHGAGWNYLAYGATQALAVVTTHYYTIGLKRWLGRKGFAAYNSNRWIHAVAIVFTFCYMAASLFFFANSFPEMQQIFRSLR